MYTILGVYQLATVTERIAGREWYPRAWQAAESIGAEYNLAPVTVAGIIAALSPRNRWERNLTDAENIIKAHTYGSPADAANVKVCTFNANKQKAIKILTDSLYDYVSIRDVLKGPKLVEFFSCIVGDNLEVCIDGHAYSVWAGDRITLDSVPKISTKLRETIKANYRNAAENVGILPSEMQAITWLTWRRLHGV